MKINGKIFETQKIIGYSNEVMKLTGNLKELQNISNTIQKIQTSSFDPNDITGMTINGKAFEIKKIIGYSNEVTKLTGRLKEFQDTANTTDMSSIEKLEIKQPKFKITGHTGNVKEFETSSLWDTLRSKIEQIKPAMQQFTHSLKSVGTNSKELELVKYKISEIKEKLENAKNGKIHLNVREIIEAEAQMERLNNKKEELEKENKGKFFSGFFSGLNKVTPSMNDISGMTIKIKNQIKQWSGGVKNGLGHVLKYAGALFSLQSIYSTLSGCAQSWLSSQNAGAKQLSANIEYMKYAMGSALAPVIQFVTNLVYQLMKAIQSVAYALTGVNIFAKASAKSYSAMAGSAKKAKQETKQLAGVHDEINNVQSNNNSDNGSGGGSAPSFDLSKINNTPNSIIEAIKKGDWYQVGVELGNKLNEAMNNIPWDKIQNTARNIGTNIAQFLNGFIATTNWSQVGNTFAQGLNTIIYFGYSFITTFDWKKFGSAISESINGFFKNVDWKAIGETCTEGINGLLDVIIGALSNLEWGSIVDALINYFEGIDFSAVTNKFFEMLGTSLGSFAKLLEVLDSKKQELIEGIKNWFSEKVEECGGNIVAGILKGVVDALLGIGQWIIDNIFTPFIEGFKNAFGIHSPSTVMEEQGNFIMQGLLNGITSLVENVKQIWENIKNTAIEKFTDIKNSISNVWQQVTNKTSETWQNIKNKVKEGAQGAWNGITSIFSNIPNWFRDKFSQAWQAVKNVFSTGGRIFDGIKEGILSGLKSIVNAIISGINKVISIPFNGLNSALRTIKNADIMGMRPFAWISTVQIPQIPRLAKGGVLYDETLVMAGEYSGAKTNPEIVTPQNIMYDTMRRALLDADIGNDNDAPINLTVYVGNTKLGQILLDNLRDIKRQSGKDLEALVGG